MNHPNDVLDTLIQCYDNGESPSSRLSHSTLCSVADHDAIELRVWLAKALAYHNSESCAVPLLCKLSQDKEACVRVEAIDSLSGFACGESFDALCCAFNDTEELVRAYSAFGIAVVGRTVSPHKAKQLLLDAADKKDSPRVFVDIYEGLYILGDKDALDRLISLFGSTDYRVKCATLHALGEILSNQNANRLREFVERIETLQYPCAVIDAIQQLKARCQEVAQTEQAESIRQHKTDGS